MVSQGSFCDSDGVPGYMQDLLGEDTFDDAVSKREVEDYPILVAAPTTGEFLGLQSSSGGIPVEKEVEVVLSEDEDTPFEDDRAAIERDTVNRVAKMAFEENKAERAELIALRTKMFELQAYLKKNGLSMERFEKDTLEQTANFNLGFQNPGSFISGRDEFGLPIFSKKSADLNSKPEASGVKVSSPKGDVKNKGDATNVGGWGENKIDEQGCPGNSKQDNEGAKDSKGVSWSQVVKNPPAGKSVDFEYIPLPSGSTVVSPPDEELMEGAEKLKCCVLGTFTKGTLPFKAVQNIAALIWKKLGLCSVFQKNETTYVFKFLSVNAKNFILSRGTWYFDSRPLVISTWGTTVGQDKISSLPLWLKLQNIPDCYWTSKGLSRLASVVGKPLCADNLTSKLEILPFAKMCVQYKIGDPLPNSITAVDFDPVSRDRTNVEVKVSYFNKPLFCSGCTSLGHKISACPLVTRKWVQKRHTQPVPNNEKFKEAEQEDSGLAHDSGTEVGPVDSVNPVETVVMDADPLLAKTPKPSEDDQSGEWTEVHNKRKPVGSPSYTPSPPVSFKNLKSVDEIDRKHGTKLSRSALKKAKRTKGRSSTQS